MVRPVNISLLVALLGSAAAVAQRQTVGFGTGSNQQSADYRRLHPLTPYHGHGYNGITRVYHGHGTATNRLNGYHK